ncbi:MAG: fasciclin [Flammeovirgaceae bacterium]|nr:fasciclin [Flammeovirgaceae bacterium]MBE61212.1 fasciclin [Flammeovirgaceae bacterium]MBR07107.1 fasciclin [Rickettsiales bacterium]|tara:strand:- start:97 stop:672 length:576 start_codon:yes stop_codon:yes gene_type:complete
MNATNLKLLILVMLAIAFWSCGSPNQSEPKVTESAAALNHPTGQASVVDEVSDPNILQVAISSEPHSMLVAAVQAAQIEHVLVNAGPLTVFAPVNSAFDALPAGTVDNLLKPENKGDLATILTRHAAPGSYDLEALKREAKKGRKLYMATGDYLEVTIDGDDVLVSGAKVVGTVPASNGIIHVIESVILPK